MEHQQLPVVLVAGAPHVGKRTLVARLLHLAASGNAAHANGAAAAPLAAAFPARLRLDTKYYTADAELHVLDLIGNEEQQQQQGGQQQQCPEEAEALVLVCAAGDAASLAAARAWAAAAPPTEGAAIRLLILNKCDLHATAADHGNGGSGGSGSGATAMRHAAAEWALDNGFELIETAAGAPDVDVTLGDEDERQGLTRVREALEAHMWPGLVRKTAAAAAANGGGGDVGGRDQSAPTEATTARAGAAAVAAVGAAAAAAAVGHSGNGVGASNGDGSSGAEGGGEGGGDAELESAVEDFEQVMQQLAGARERLAKLPDEERRTQAAAMALRFAEMLGLGSDDADDEA